MAYRTIRALARLLLSLFYGRIEVVGGEHIPANRPVIIVANHHNSLVDSMLIMTAARRPLVILAAAPLFRYPVIGSLLRLAGAPGLRAHRARAAARVHAVRASHHRRDLRVLQVERSGEAARRRTAHDKMNRRSVKRKHPCGRNSWPMR